MEKYNKIMRLGTIEVDDIFSDRDDFIVVQEKTDGCNFRVMKEEGELKFGSRRISNVTKSDGWGDIIEYLEDNIDLEALEEGYIYVGEAMKKHKISYDFDNLPKFIGYDVLDAETGLPVPFHQMDYMMTAVGLPIVHVKFLGSVEEFLKENIDDFMQESAYGDVKPEGIVIKNYNRLNRFGRPLFAKKVSKSFEEVKKKKDKNYKPKSCNTPQVVDSYVTDVRIEKIIYKLVNEEGLPLERSLMGKLIPRVIEDTLQEEILEILKDKEINQIDFKVLSSLVPNRCLNVLDKIIDKFVEAQREIEEILHIQIR